MQLLEAGPDKKERIDLPAGQAELSMPAQKSGFTQACRCISVPTLLPGFFVVQRDFLLVLVNFGVLVWEARPQESGLGRRGLNRQKMSQHPVLVPVSSRTFLSLIPSLTQSKDSVLTSRNLLQFMVLAGWKKSTGLLLPASVVSSLLGLLFQLLLPLKPLLALPNLFSQQEPFL